VEEVTTSAGHQSVSEQLLGGLIPELYGDLLIAELTRPQPDWLIEMRDSSRQRAEAAWRALPLRTRVRHHLRRRVTSARSSVAVRIAPWLRDGDEW
jgi:hypothetical protein